MNDYAEYLRKFIKKAGIFKNTNGSFLHLEISKYGKAFIKEVHNNFIIIENRDPHTDYAGVWAIPLNLFSLFLPEK